MTRSITSTISAIGRQARCCACAARRCWLTASIASGVRTGRDKQIVSGPVPKVKLVVASVPAFQPGKKYGGASTVGITPLLSTAPGCCARVLRRAHYPHQFGGGRV